MVPHVVDFYVVSQPVCACREITRKMDRAFSGAARVETVQLGRACRLIIWSKSDRQVFPLAVRFRLQTHECETDVVPNTLPRSVDQANLHRIAGFICTTRCAEFDRADRRKAIASRKHDYEREKSDRARYPKPDR